MAASVPDDQLTAWADQVHVAGSWVSGPHRKKLVALAQEIATWANPEPQGRQAPDLEAPSPASSAAFDDDPFGEK